MISFQLTLKNQILIWIIKAIFILKIQEIKELIELRMFYRKLIYLIKLY